MKYTLLATTVILMSGCASPARVGDPILVKPATAEQVAGCIYLDDVVGTSGLYGMFASQGSDNARQDVLLKAERMGATHIAWGPAQVGYGSTAAVAKAYRCSNK